MGEREVVKGKVFYDTGELYFKGRYYPDNWNNLLPWKPVELIEGITYYRNGNKHEEGKFQWGGLLIGSTYYESGALKFEGIYNDKYSLLTETSDEQLIEEYQNIWQKYQPGKTSGSYYGPVFPICGRFYSEDGKKFYEGCSRVERVGSMGYPIRLRAPEWYGKLS